LFNFYHTLLSIILHSLNFMKIYSHFLWLYLSSYKVGFSSCSRILFILSLTPLTVPCHEPLRRRRTTVLHKSDKAWHRHRNPKTRTSLRKECMKRTGISLSLPQQNREIHTCTREIPAWCAWKWKHARIVRPFRAVTAHSSESECMRVRVFVNSVSRNNVICAENSRENEESWESPVAWESFRLWFLCYCATHKGKRPRRLSLLWIDGKVARWRLFLRHGHRRRFYQCYSSNSPSSLCHSPVSLSPFEKKTSGVKILNFYLQ
jgi:hypothetical protein